ADRIGLRRVFDQLEVVLGVDDAARREGEVLAYRELLLVDHGGQAAVAGHVAQELPGAGGEVAAALLEGDLHRRRVGQERVGRGERGGDGVGGDRRPQLVR